MERSGKKLEENLKVKASVLNAPDSQGKHGLLDALKLHTELLRYLPYPRIFNEPEL
jgi:hypothetical protein